MNCDFIRDMLDRLTEAIQRDGAFSDSLAREIEQQLRHDWAGERIYIARNGADAKIEMTLRNQTIIRDMNNGERVGLIARRHHISRRMVYKVWDQNLANRKKTM